MFEEAFRIATLGTGNFREVVRDSFGASIISDALEPILKEIDSLRHHNEEFQRQAIEIDRVLQEARSIQLTA